METEAAVEMVVEMVVEMAAMVEMADNGNGL
jgi:hypothetical protein